MRKILFLTVIVLCLSGCRQSEAVPTETAPLCRYVTQVDVTCRQADQVLHKQYTRDEKIESVLHYLRLLHNHGDTQDLPADADQTDYEIVLSFSDGGCRVYHQRGSAYLSQDGGPWLVLEQWQGRKLLTLFRLMPSDV